MLSWAETRPNIQDMSVKMEKKKASSCEVEYKTLIYFTLILIATVADRHNIEKKKLLGREGGIHKCNNCLASRKNTR